MNIPYDKIVAIKVLYNDIPKKGILNRIKRVIYIREMNNVVKLLQNSLRKNTVVYKQDIIRFCNFIRSVSLDTGSFHLKVDIYDDTTYKITIDEGWGRYTRVDVTGPDIHGIEISSTNPYSDIISKSTNGIVTNRTNTEKTIYTIMIDCILQYIYT